jgi:5-formyltetrahydrofolate cyclo-ligase
MKRLKPRERAFWDEWRAGLPPSKRPRRAFVEAGFAGNRRATDALIRLYLSGRKTAGSGLVRDYRTAGDPLPRRGNHWIVLDGRGRPRLLLRTVRVEFSVFGRLPARIARAEGEGDRTVAHWKRVHRRLYAPFLARWGIDDLDAAEVVTETFRLLRAAPVSG